VFHFGDRIVRMNDGAIERVEKQNQIPTDGEPPGP
jgi:hypothetical protein